MFVLCGSVACAQARLLPTPPAARLFVSNEGSNTVSVIDLAAGRLVQTIAVGKRPRGIHASANGEWVYVAVTGSAPNPPGAAAVPDAPRGAPDRAADGIVELNAHTGAIVRVLPCGPDPENFGLTPDGRLLIAANEEDAQATVLDLRSGQVVTTIPTGAEPEGVGVRPDGQMAYVTSEDEGTITVIDLTARTAVTSFPAGQRPRGVAFSSDGALAYVTGEQSRTVTVVDAQQHRVLDTLRFEAKTARPMGIVVSPDNRTLYVSTGRGGGVATLDLAGRKVVGTVPDVGARVWGLALSADGKRLYATTGPSNDVAVLDLRDGRVAQRLAVGDHPWGLALVEAR